MEDHSHHTCEEDHNLNTISKHHCEEDQVRNAMSLKLVGKIGDKSYSNFPSLNGKLTISALVRYITIFTHNEEF